MLELGIGADLVRGVGLLYQLLFLGALAFALWYGSSWKRKLIHSSLVLLVFLGPALPSMYRTFQYKHQYAKAKALFDERCKTAGEKIYRTVDDVDGILLLKVRRYDAAESDPMMAGAAAAQESYGDFYIRSFLLFEKEQRGTGARALVQDRTTTSRPGYRFVDVVDPSDRKRYRYTLGEDLSVKRLDALGPAPRYGVTFDDIVDPADRAYWVAGSTIKVLDMKVNETVGEFIRYVIEPGQGSRAGQRAPWGSATGCGMSTSYGRDSARLFVDQVLKPTKQGV